MDGWMDALYIIVFEYLIKYNGCLKWNGNKIKLILEKKTEGGAFDDAARLQYIKAGLMTLTATTEFGVKMKLLSW